MLAQNSTVRIVRKMCRLTQAELGQIVDCARLTIHGLEAGKLKLSPKMAERLALHAGVSKSWLLAGDCRTQPCCERHPDQPFTREIFESVRADICDSRTKPVDLFGVFKYVEGFCSELRASAIAAYSRDDIIYFYYKFRQVFNEVAGRWKLSGSSGLTRDEFWETLEKISIAKKMSHRDGTGSPRFPLKRHGRTRREQREQMVPRSGSIRSSQHSSAKSRKLKRSGSQETEVAKRSRLSAQSGAANRSTNWIKR